MNSEKNVQNSLKYQYRFDSNYSGVMKDANGNYALAVDMPDDTSPVLLPVGYLQIDLLNPASVNKVLNHPNLSAEIKESVHNMAQSAEPCDKCDNCNIVSIFSPDLLAQTRSTTTSYYTYDGTRMKVDRIERDSHTEYGTITSSKGEEFMSLLNGISDVTLAVAGCFSLPISIFGAGVTVFNAIADHSSINTVSSVNSSQVQVRVLFHGITQYTYAYIEDWRIGCVSHLAEVQKTQFDYILYDGDNRKCTNNFSVLVDRTVKTESYDNHWAIARNNYHSPQVDNPIVYTIGSLEFILRVS